MKTYPTISTAIVSKPIYAFDKLDGSNIRTFWTRKGGFTKFGRRHALLDDSNPILKRSVDLFMNKYSESLQKIFKDNRWSTATCFFEFFGPSSFAGVHLEDEMQDVVLFDVSAEKRGMLEPREFIRTFGDLDIAKVLYHGNPTDEFVTSVRDGSLSGMTFEGVVCKGQYVSPGLPLMFKVKNEAWISRVKSLYVGDEKMIAQLL